jgi:hypothetical protein
LPQRVVQDVGCSVVLCHQRTPGVVHLLMV